jgi:RHS repeat-associated protein
MVADALYGESGGLGRWVAGNALKTEVVLDDYVKSRVKEIKVLNSAGATVWTTGMHTYDGGGNLRTIGATDIFTYDLAGRLREALVAGSTGSPLYRDVFTYDPFGNLAGKERSINWGIPQGESYQIEPSTNRIVCVNQGPIWTYRENGAVTFDGTFNYAYDNAGRLAQIQVGGTEIGAYRYGGSGLRIFRRENHGKEVFYFRDGQGNVLSQFSRPVGTTLLPVWDRDFVYLGNLRIAMIEEPLPSAVSWMQSSSTGSGISLEWFINPETDVYGYLIFRRDPGQISFAPLYSGSSSITTTTSSYLDANVAPGATYVYKIVAVDAAGNQGAPSVERQITFQDATPPGSPTGLAATPGNAKVTLAWSAPSPTVPDLAGYKVYRRLSGGTHGAPLNGIPVTTTNYIDLAVTNGTTYYYVVRTVDTAGLVSDPSNEVSAKPTSKQMGFNQTDDWDGRSGGLQLARSGNQPGVSQVAPYTITAQSLGEKIFFLHADRLGSIRLVTDTQAAPVTTHAYAAYGEELQPMASTNPYKYAGYERDAESLLDYVRARFYMPRMGRWTSPDPLGDGFQYARSNPLSYIDPSGLVIQCVQVCTDDGFGGRICERKCYDDPPTPFDELEFATYFPDPGPLPPAQIRTGGSGPVMNPPPPAPPEQERECGYLDGTASVVVGPGAYTGVIAGVQKNPAGDMYLVGGRTWGVDAGTNLLLKGLGGPMFSLTQSLPGQTTGPGAFAGGQVTLFGITAQLSGAVINWRPSWALEIGVNTSLLGANVQAGGIVPIGQGAPLAGCR